MTRKELAHTLARAQVLHPEVKITEAVLDVWYELFAKEEFLNFYTAFMQTLKDHTWYPKPADVSKRLKSTKDNGISAHDEWNILIGFAKSGDAAGAYAYAKEHYPTFKALSAVGFDEMRFSNLETEIAWRKKEFVDVFNKISENYEAKQAYMLTQDESRKALSKIESALGKKLLN